MSEETNSNLKRRSVMKMLSGATTAAVSFGAISGSAIAADGSAKVGPEEVTGKERKRAIRAAQTSEEFKALRKKFAKDEDYRVSNLKDATVVEMDDAEGIPHIIVGKKLKSKEFLQETSVGDNSASIAITLNDSDVVSAKTIVSTQQEAISQISTASSSADVNISAKTYTAEGDSLNSETSSVTVNPEKTDGGPDQISIQESDTCWACKLIGDTICAMGCSVGAALICSAAGLAGGAPGIACGAIVSALCGIFAAAEDRYVGAGCGPDYGVEAACYYADYCANNPLK